MAGRLVGNFPQAFSHVSLVNSASKITGYSKPSADHVFLGLARRAMSGARPTGMSRMHMGPDTKSALRELIAAGGRTGLGRPPSPVEESTPAGRVSGRRARKSTTKSSKQAPAATNKVTVRKSTARTVTDPSKRAASSKKAAPAKKAAKKAR